MLVVLVPTWRCNLEAEMGKCPYCFNDVSEDGLYVKAFWQDVGTIEGREATAKEWLTFFSKVPPSFVDICGGEPLCWSGLSALVEGLPKGFTWGITSNCITPEVIEPLDLTRCRSWTASFHPYAMGKADYGNRFFQSLRILLSRHLNLYLSLVAYHGNIDWLAFWIEAFHGWGFRVNVLPYENPKYDWREHPQELTKLEEVKASIPEGRAIYWETNVGRRLCGAGKDYVVASPCGNIYRCYKRMVTGEAPLGNVFSDGDFLLKEASLCELACSVSCDLERRGKVEDLG